MPCRGAKPLGPHPGICRQGCPLSLCFRSPRAFSLLAAAPALMRALPLLSIVFSVARQSTNLQSVGFCAGAGPSAHSRLCLHQRRRRRRRKRWRMRGGSSEALSIVRQQWQRPTRSLQDARNCQLFPDNTLVVVFFNRCNPANYDGGRLAGAKNLMIH